MPGSDAKLRVSGSFRGAGPGTAGGFRAQLTLLGAGWGRDFRAVGVVLVEDVHGCCIPVGGFEMFFIYFPVGIWDV